MVLKKANLIGYMGATGVAYPAQNLHWGAYL